ncbi:MAG: LPS export ABC transporter ATP-binding protein, partial [Gammaproteobacteria bacterium]
MSVLKATGLAKRYGARTVVTNVSLEVSSGEVVGLLGPNGAGKTTSFYMITGLVACNSGSVCIDEDDLTEKPIHARAQAGLGYLPQEPSVFRKLSVRHNVMAILELRSGMDRVERELRAAELLDELGIGHLSESLGQNLSGGERRRVEIARALAGDPHFMLLDEPFAGVDPLSVIDIQRIVKHLCERGIGVLITDHNVRETLGICDRAYIVDQGTIIASGHPAEILEHRKVREVYLGEGF